MKPISQFRIPYHFKQHKSLDFYFDVSPKSSSNLNENCDFKSEKKPEPRGPGTQENVCNRIIHDAYLSTETKSLISLQKSEPDLVGSGSSAMSGTSTTPIIAYPELNASGNLVCAEMAVNYSGGGFVKLPRSLFVHPAWNQALSKHKCIFLEFLYRAAWGPVSFYWNGAKFNLSAGQLYFSQRKLATELTQLANDREEITYADVRGAIRYFQKCRFISLGLTQGFEEKGRDLTQDLTQGLTQGLTIITILYSEFSIDDNFRSNAGSNATSNEDLTQASRTKEEKKEKKEEKKTRSTRKPASVDNADALRLCSNFAALLEKTLPGIKLPSSMAKWQSEFDLMLRIDGRSPKDIEFLFEKMPGHWYSKNVQSASKFREKFPVLMAHHTEQQNDTSINRSWFLQAKKDNPRELRSWTASGEWVLNSHNSKEISLKMGHSEFQKAFLSACGGTLA